ncbi:MAG TPA: DUF1499 domain-containing protein [Prosthecochloris aestuarii]|uniref:DUF1499 domain-containing protein n=1 Tax=Prosthecochloris aestuarii TaxID=1102 RepID=A0A831STQ9_PROAE|nr:DUF1499 domain-containing protein [Prosthecochloris sp.]HED31562.1 DUF1499 domain-containing protein [Prosthecochloris aestuarii]
MLQDLVRGVTGAMSGLWPAPADEPALLNGQLRPCPGTPNCVCSETGNEAIRVDPLVYTGDADDAWSRLQRVVRQMEGKIERIEGDYLWSTFTVPFLGFVDDVEFRLDRNAGVIQVRSASRLGYSDLGINRSRVDDIRRRFSV